MMLTGFVRMVSGMQPVAVGNMRMMRGLFMIACFMMLSRLAVVLRCVLVMIGGLLVMLCAFVCHKESPLNLSTTCTFMRVGHKVYTPVKAG